MAGEGSSEPTEKRSAALQEGLITYTSCERKSRTGEEAYWALRLEPEGEPFRGTHPIPQPTPPWNFIITAENKTLEFS